MGNDRFIDIMEMTQRDNLKNILLARYTNDELSKLVHILNMGNIGHLLFFGAHNLCIFQAPIEDMPLYVNEDPRDNWNSQVAKWRLDCGK